MISVEQIKGLLEKTKSLMNEFELLIGSDEFMATEEETSDLFIESEPEHPDKAVCRICGCTQDHACSGGCWWVEPDLCSSCHETVCTAVATITNAQSDIEDALNGLDCLVNPEDYESDGEFGDIEDDLTDEDVKYNEDMSEFESMYPEEKK